MHTPASSSGPVEVSPRVATAFTDSRTSDPDRTLPLRMKFIIALWALAVIACSAAMLWAARQPGPIGTPLEPSVAVDPIGPAKDTPTLFIAVHPHCPCTRATIANLQRALTTADGSLRITALVYQPRGQDDAWAETDLVQTIRTLPSARTVRDTDGRTAAHFGMHTSGQVLYYDRSGRIRFCGGITQGRGHEGDCEPLRSLQSLLADTTASSDDSPTLASVFGCSLANEGSPTVFFP